MFPSSGPELRAGRSPRRQQEVSERSSSRREHESRPRQIQDAASDPPGKHQAEDRRVRVLVENLRDPKTSQKYLTKVQLLIRV